MQGDLALPLRLERGHSHVHATRRLIDLLQAALYIALALLPLQGAFVISWGAHIQPSELVMLALIGLFGLAVIRGRVKVIGRPPLMLALAVLLAIFMISTLMTFPLLRSATRLHLITEYPGGRESPSYRSFITAGWAVYCVAAYLVTYWLVEARQQLARCLRALLLGASAAGLYGVAQWIALLQAIHIVLPGDVSHFGAVYWTIPRAYSTFIEPATLGAFMVMVLPITLTLVAARNTQVAQPAELWIDLVLQTAGLVVSFSVGQWIGFAIVLPLLAVLALRFSLFQWWRIPLIFGAVFATILLGAGLWGLSGVLPWRPDFTHTQPTTLGAPAQSSAQPTPAAAPSQAPTGFPLLEGFRRKLTNQDLSSGTRIQLAVIALRMFRDHPVLGVGIGNFVFAEPDYSRELGFRFDYQNSALLSAANLYLSLIAETGVLGIIAFFAVIAVLGRRIYSAVKLKIDPGLQVILLGLSGSLIAIGVSNLFLDNLFVLGYWILAGLTMGACKLISRAAPPVAI